LIGVPHAEAYGSRFRREAYHLIPIRVGIFAGMVFAALDPLVDSLEEYLGDAAPFLEKFWSHTEVIGRLRWVYNGNWKLWQENFRDNYHPEFTHRFVRDCYQGCLDQGANHQLSDGHGLLIMPPVPLNFEQYGVALKSASGLDIDARRNPNWDVPCLWVDDGRVDVILTIFPNLDLTYFVLGTSLALHVLHPQGVARTVVEMIQLGRRGESAEVRQWRLERSLHLHAAHGPVTADDVEALDRCRRGLQARINRPVNISRGQKPGKVGETRDEYSIRSFYAAWRRYMQVT